MFFSNRFRGLVPPSFQKLTREILPSCVYSYAPSVSYVESSPVVSDEAAKAISKGSTDLVGSEAHFYRNIKLNYEGIRACRSLFIGETGPIGTNPFTDNERIYKLEKDRLERLWNTPYPPLMVDMHQHDSYLINKIRFGSEICKIWFDKEFTSDQYLDFAFGVNVICSNLYKDIIEICRTSRWEKTGVLWWSLLDMWPMICNYSVVDCDFRPKLPYYSIKQSQQPFALTAVRKKVGGEMALYYANDTLETHNVTFKITAYTADGNSYEVATGSCDMKPNEAEKLLPLPKTEKTELWLIEWNENGKIYHNHIFTADQHADLDAYRRWYDMLKPLYGIQ
jgi:beta-mannosidase